MDFQTCKQKVTFDSFNLSWLRIATEVPVHYVHCWLGTSAPDRSQHFCSDMHSGHMPGSNRKVLYLMQIAKYSNVIAVVQSQQKMSQDSFSESPNSEGSLCIANLGIPW